MRQITIETPTSLLLQKARTSLILDDPFFGSLPFRLKGRECRSIETMATDGVSLFYNPEFVASGQSVRLNPVEETEPILAHALIGSMSMGFGRRPWSF